MPHIFNHLGNKQDEIECYTPKYAIDGILKFLPKDKVIWAPFDLESSNFVRHLRLKGYKVLFSHINLGQDFLKYEPKEHWDYILSNPPFMNKRAFLQRCLDLGKPFILLLPIIQLMNDEILNWLIEQVHIQLIIPNKRISFIHKIKRPVFKVAWFCANFGLKKDINSCAVYPVRGGENSPMIQEYEETKPSKKDIAERYLKEMNKGVID